MRTTWIVIALVLAWFLLMAGNAAAAVTVIGETGSGVYLDGAYVGVVPVRLDASHGGLRELAVVGRGYLRRALIWIGLEDVERTIDMRMIPLDAWVVPETRWLLHPTAADRERTFP